MVAAWVALTLGGIYALSGFTKVFPFPKPVHQHQVKEFKEFAKVFPLRGMGIQLDDVTYRLLIGISEMALGAGLIVTESATRRLCCLGCMVIMAGAVYTLVQLKKYNMAPVPAAFFLALFWLFTSLP